jgi:hypothetical protein
MEEMSCIFKVLSYHIPKRTEEEQQNLVLAAGKHVKIQSWDHQNIKQGCRQPNHILDLVTQTILVKTVNT